MARMYRDYEIFKSGENYQVRTPEGEVWQEHAVNLPTAKKWIDLHIAETQSRKKATIPLANLELRGGETVTITPKLLFGETTAYKEPDNADRARWAKNALTVFTRETYSGDEPDTMHPGDMETAIQDLMTDLLHLADARGFKSRELYEQAKARYLEEIDASQAYNSGW